MKRFLGDTRRYLKETLPISYLENFSETEKRRLLDAVVYYVEEPEDPAWLVWLKSIPKRVYDVIQTFYDVIQKRLRG